MGNKLYLRHVFGKWWIDRADWEELCGPYDTRSEAEEDRAGLERTYRHHNEPGFITVDPGKEV